ncbi:hypothetical protein LTR08_004326 [Meristemomyces frigidus]|nr:hypothetical protein LTR08_004326 [Meristemomyces frigidus]
MAWRITLPSILIALSALLFCLNPAPIEGSAAAILDTLRLGSLSQKPRDPLNGSQHDSAAPPEAEWDVMRHQGGNSPWFRNEHGGDEGGIDPPPGCRVDQVHMISRHAECYPTAVAGGQMLALHNHLQTPNLTLHATLAFAPTTPFFLPDPPTPHFNTLVPTGPHAGTLQALATGTQLRTRYAHLLARALAANETTTFWASDSACNIATAENFAAGFFGREWARTGAARLQVIPETAGRGQCTLTPSRSCRKYVEDSDGEGSGLGARKLAEWRALYLPPIIARLAAQNPGVTFTETEIYSMQELCGFETIVKGGSQWCDVFTREEWAAFEHGRDLLHYYRSGAGNRYSGVLGTGMLGAMARLLGEGGERGGGLFFSLYVTLPLPTETHTHAHTCTETNNEMRRRT